MEFGAVALALLGFAIGLTFGVRVLIPTVAVIAVLTVRWAIGGGCAVGGTVFALLVAQTILQASYFLGLVTRALCSEELHALEPADGVPTTLVEVDGSSSTRPLSGRLAEGM